MNAEIEAIAAYTGKFPELAAAHHFLFDLKCPPLGHPQFVVMGINPGETANCWKIAPKPTEESSRFDFHAAHGDGREGIRWVKAARYFLDGADYVQSELFFWSSNDMAQFKARFGDLKLSRHLPFCTRMNQRLIDTYTPKAVVFPGLGYARVCAKEFGLHHQRSIESGGARLVEIYTDGKRPWLFTKHWTGSFGLSNAQRNTIRTAIRAA